MKYIVFSDRDKTRLYLGKDETWWSDQKMARKFDTEREAQNEVKRSEVATGYKEAE